MVAKNSKLAAAARCAAVRIQPPVVTVRTSVRPHNGITPLLEVVPGCSAWQACDDIAGRLHRASGQISYFLGCEEGLDGPQLDVLMGVWEELSIATAILTSVQNGIADSERAAQQRTAERGSAQ